MSALSRQLTSGGEDWQDLVQWDEELYDPLFGQGDIPDYNQSFTSDYHVPESVVSDQPDASSGPTSIVDGPTYCVSGPPSIADGPSSLGQTFSWLSTSPSFSTTATSPQVGRSQECNPEPFDGRGAYPIDIDTESPLPGRGEAVFATSFDSAGSFHTASPYIFNPHIGGSPHSFSSLDVNASQTIEAISNVGGWMEQPQIIEPIPELDHVGAIPIPQPHGLGYNAELPELYAYSRSEEIRHEGNRARAITIPQPNQRPASYNPNRAPSRWAHQVPPVLSVSPDSRRRPRSTTLSRSISRTDPRRTRNSLTTPSPTSNTFGWVSYQPNHQTNKLVPLGADGTKGRRQRGRTKALTLEQRRNAALMRVVGACSNCKRRKEKCDPGIPCKSCLDHFKGDLIHFPCRDRLLSDLTKSFLSERLGWHPTGRALEAFVNPNDFNVLKGITYSIPLNLGFGTPLHVSAHAVQISDKDVLYHNHVIYSWPPAIKDVHTHAILPAVLAAEEVSRLHETLDTHLSLLVTQHFRSFPLFCSPLRILREVYVFYRALPTTNPHSRILLQALKLLVLVHIGGDLTLPEPSTDSVLQQLIRTSTDIPPDTTPTPCFIRSQFGAIMPGLAQSLMKDVLSALEQLMLNRDCNEWPIALAVLIVVLMTIESIHYHAAKLPYHHSFDVTNSNTQDERNIAAVEDRKVDEQGIKTLFAFYSACFAGCHVRLSPEWQGEPSSLSPVSPSSLSPTAAYLPPAGLGKAEEHFIESIREAIKKANHGAYLNRKATADREGEDMDFFFDRHVAKLLILKT
jgi:hypothetical protein